MKKKSEDEKFDELRPEYDLGELLREGVQGKYAERCREGTSLVQSEPDAVDAFPILLATRNQGKIREIRDVAKSLPVTFLSLDEVDPLPEVEEDGDTFEANALKKARVIAKATGMATLADDSGLSVDALDGRPGVLSARYAGENATDKQLCDHILEEMRDVPDDRRSARFICVLALVLPTGEERLFRGVCEGNITREIMGKLGFGYDPIFYFDEAGCTFAQMGRDAKNKVSHRGRALEEFARYLSTGFHEHC
jgi:XTP/dITP diphosphohydrolase